MAVDRYRANEPIDGSGCRPRPVVAGLLCLLLTAGAARGEDRPTEKEEMVVPEAERVGSSRVVDCPARFVLPLRVLQLERWQSIRLRGFSCEGHPDVRLVTIQTKRKRDKLEITLWVRQDEGRDKLVSVDFRLIREDGQLLLSRRLGMELDEGELNWDSIRFGLVSEDLVRLASSFEMILESVEPG